MKTPDNSSEGTIKDCRLKEEESWWGQIESCSWDTYSIGFPGHQRKAGVEAGKEAKERRLSGPLLLIGVTGNRGFTSTATGSSPLKKYPVLLSIDYWLCEGRQSSRKTCRINNSPMSALQLPEKYQQQQEAPERSAPTASGKCMLWAYHTKCRFKRQRTWRMANNNENINKPVNLASSGSSFAETSSFFATSIDCQSMLSREQ